MNCLIQSHMRSRMSSKQTQEEETERSRMGQIGVCAVRRFIVSEGNGKVSTGKKFESEYYVLKEN